MTDAAMRVLPEMGIPLIKKTKTMDLQERAAAMCETVLTLTGLGMDLPEPDPEDEFAAERMITGYAADPEEASKELTDTIASTVTPATLLLVHDTLEKFGHMVVKDSVKIRHYVTNKLIVESDNPDPKIRMKALELLGKMSDVGLFTEKKLITIENTSTEELRGKLRNKLENLRANAIDADYEEVIEPPADSE